MKKILLLVIALCFLQQHTNAQFATFTADSTELRKLIGDNNERLFNKILEMEWIINDDTLKFGSSEIYLITNENKLDTIYFKVNAKSAYDTLICNIAQPIKYRFIYNTCCGGFDVIEDKTNNRIGGKVLMKISKSPVNEIYLGTFGEAGMIIGDAFKDTLSVTCTSAMSSNIYAVKLIQIESCKASETCETLMCFQATFGKDKFDYDYKTVSQKLNFLYLPLSNKPLPITYNLLSNTISIE